MFSIHLRLGLLSDLFPAGFPTNNIYTFLFFPVHATCPAHLIQGHRYLLTIKGIEEWRLLRFSSQRASVASYS
jgi:hypothetical protein